MVIKTYKIKNPTQEVVEFLNLLSNRVSLETRPGEVSVSVDHADNTAEISFESDLSKRLGIEIDGAHTNLGKFIDEIKTDVLLYAIEFNPLQGVIKTNLGTAYTNVFNDFNGRPFFVDTTGFKSLTVQILWSKAGGTSAHNMRIVNNADDTQVLESGSLGLTANSDDFPNIAIPAGFQNFKGKWRLQCKAGNAQDDPVFFGIRIYMRR